MGPEERGFRKAAICWFGAWLICIVVTNRHFSAMTADLISWIPFSVFLYCAFKAWQANSSHR